MSYLKSSCIFPFRQKKKVLPLWKLYLETEGNTVQKQNKKTSKTKKAYIACLMVISPKEGRNRITVSVDLVGEEIFRRET